MEVDQEMSELYDGSTESDEERLLYPLGDSYETLVYLIVQRLLTSSGSD